jgi:ferritin-like metal-binding protein YciE
LIQTDQAKVAVTRGCVIARSERRGLPTSDETTGHHLSLEQCGSGTWEPTEQNITQRVRNPIRPQEVEMGLFTKDIKTMEDMFVHGLQDIYYAEHQITKALPKMIEKATNRDLAAGLKAHLEETNSQIERLQKVFQKLGKEPKAADCPAIDGLIKEADTLVGEIDDKAVLDAAIVASAQAVEHYEIARYGTLIAWAEELGHDDVVRFLTTNLNEEKAANTKLNTVALRKGVNKKAVA